MTAATITPEDLSKDIAKETFMAWVEKGLDKVAGSARNIADTLFDQSLTSQTRAEHFKSQLSALSDLTAESYAKLNSIDIGTLDPSVVARLEAFKAESGKASAFLSSAKLNGVAGDNLEVLGKVVGTLVGSIDLVSALNHNPTQADISKEALVAAVGITVAVVTGSFSVVAAVGVSITAAEITKQVWDTSVLPALNAHGVELDQPFWDSAFDSMGLHPDPSVPPAAMPLAPAPDPIPSENPAGQAVMQVNQYRVDDRDLVSLKFIDSNGVVRGEVAKPAGDGGTPALIKSEHEGTVIELEYLLNPEDQPRDAERIKSTDIPLSLEDFNNALSYAMASLGSDYEGNTVDYANEIAVMAGLSEYGLGNMDYSVYAGQTGDLTVDPGLHADGLAAYLDPMTDAGRYAFATSYLLGNDWASLWNDDRGDAMLAELEALTARLGRSVRWNELMTFGETWSDAGGSPIALDLNGDGVKTISIADSRVNFDITGDGQVERTGWLSPEDAFLTLDINGNGQVDGASELFGGLARGEGYARLGGLDDNSDLAITLEDQAFSALKLWRDQNSDGISDAGELFSLQELGVTALGLDYTSQTVRDHGNLLGEVSVARRGDQDTAMADVYFRFTSVEEADKGIYSGRHLNAQVQRPENWKPAETHDDGEALSLAGSALTANALLALDYTASQYSSQPPLLA